MVVVKKEKRRLKRVEFREPLRYSKGALIPLSGSLAYDLSEGGLRFQTEDFIPLNESLAIMMELSPEKVLSLHGRVVWVQMVPHSDRYHVGLKFDNDDSMMKSREVIKEYIGTRQSK